MRVQRESSESPVKVWERESLSEALTGSELRAGGQEGQGFEEAPAEREKKKGGSSANHWQPLATIEWQPLNGNH